VQSVEFQLTSRRNIFFAELVYSTLELEATCSSETSVETQRTTRRHVPEDDTLHLDEKLMNITETTLHAV
jgi:hypothetical protein